MHCNNNVGEVMISPANMNVADIRHKGGGESIWLAQHNKVPLTISLT